MYLWTNSKIIFLQLISGILFNIDKVVNSLNPTTSSLCNYVLPKCNNKHSKESLVSE